MQDGFDRVRPRGSPWAWLPLALLLATNAYWSITPLLAVQLDLSLLIPVLSGWLASRFGPRIAPFLLTLGLVSLLGLATPAFSGFWARWGIPSWIYALAILAAIAFSRPKWNRPAAKIFRAPWRWLRWLAVIAVWLAVFEDRAFRWEASETLQVGINPGFVLLVLALAASVDWQAVFAWFRAVFVRGNGILHRVLPTALTALLVLAFLVHARWVLPDGFAVSFGFSSGQALVPVVAFLLAASGLVDWRLIVALLGLFFASGFAVPWLGDAIAMLLRDTSDLAGDATRARQLGQSYVDWAGLVRALAAVFLGVALSPFWRHQDPDALRTGRTSLFLFLTLALQFFGMPVYSSQLGSTGLMLVGGSAYVMGLRWQVRGIVAGPLLIQLVYLLAFSLRCLHSGCGANALDLVNIGLVAFPFAFFGLLSNRYRAIRADRDIPAGAGGMA